MNKFAWSVAGILALVIVAEYFLLQAQQRMVVAGYEQKVQELQQQMAKLQADAEARLKKAGDDAAAAQQALQTELDYAKLPQMPLKVVYRPAGPGRGLSLYIENESLEFLSCDVRLERPGKNLQSVQPYTLGGRQFQEIGAIGTWLLEAGDKVEFTKVGYQSRRLELK